MCGAGRDIIPARFVTAADVVRVVTVELAVYALLARVPVLRDKYY